MIAIAAVDENFGIGYKGDLFYPATLIFIIN